MNKTKFIIYCAILNVSVIFLSPLNFSIRFIGSALLLFFGGVFLLKHSPFQNKKKSLLYIYGLWISLIIFQIGVSSFVSGFLGIPVIIISLLAIIMAIMFYEKEKKILLKNSLLFVVIIGLLTYLLPNYYTYIFYKENKMVNQPLPNLTIYDEKGIPFNFKKDKGKILVFDLWNSSCANCIKDFPKFEKLKKEFKNDTTVHFYSINISLTRDFDKKEWVQKLTKKYSFKTLYTDTKMAKTLNIESVPNYMIVDKNHNITYIGDLNTDKAVFYNNFYDILNKIK